MSRSRQPDDPELLSAKSDLATDKLAAYITRVLDTAPPLSDEQRIRLVELLQTPAEPRNRQQVVAERLAELGRGAD